MKKKSEEVFGKSALKLSQKLTQQVYIVSRFTYNYIKISY